MEMKLYSQSIKQTLIEFAQGDSKKSWIQIFKTGNFSHPELGDFTVNKKDLDRLVTNFEDNVQETQPSINLDHSRKDAVGWFEALKTRNSGSELWALIDWTELGVQKVGKDLYRYISAELLFSRLDPKSKNVSATILTGAALTNHPAIKGMAQVNFSENCQIENVFFETPKKGKTMNLTEIIVALSALGIDFNEMKRQSESVDGLNLQFTDLQNSSKTVSVELSEANTKLKSANLRIEELEKEKTDADFSELVKVGMETGKITKAYAEGDFRELFDKMGAEFAKKHLDGLKKTVETDFSGSGDDKNKNGVKNPNELILEATKKIQADKECDFSEATNILLADKPEMFEDAEKYADEKS